MPLHSFLTSLSSGLQMPSMPPTPPTPSTPSTPSLPSVGPKVGPHKPDFAWLKQAENDGVSLEDLANHVIDRFDFAWHRGRKTWWSRSLGEELPRTEIMSYVHEKYILAVKNTPDAEEFRETLRSRLARELKPVILRQLIQRELPDVRNTSEGRIDLLENAFSTMIERTRSWFTTQGVRRLSSLIVFALEMDTSVDEGVWVEFPGSQLYLRKEFLPSPSTVSTVSTLISARGPIWFREIGLHRSYPTTRVLAASLKASGLWKNTVIRLPTSSHSSGPSSGPSSGGCSRVWVRSLPLPSSLPEGHE